MAWWKSLGKYTTVICSSVGQTSVNSRKNVMRKWNGWKKRFSAKIHKLNFTNTVWHSVEGVLKGMKLRKQRAKTSESLERQQHKGKDLELGLVNQASEPIWMVKSCQNGMTFQGDTKLAYPTPLLSMLTGVATAKRGYLREAFSPYKSRAPLHLWCRRQTRSIEERKDGRGL